MKQTTTQKVSHAKFWTLLKQTNDYNEIYKENIKESWVNKYSQGTHSSLPAFYKDQPFAYQKMLKELESEINILKQGGQSRQNTQRRKLLALIYSFCEHKGYTCNQQQAVQIACKACGVQKLNDATEQKIIAAIKKFDNNVLDIMVDELVKTCIKTNKK